MNTPNTRQVKMMFLQTFLTDLIDKQRMVVPNKPVLTVLVVVPGVGSLPVSHIRGYAFRPRMNGGQAIQSQSRPFSLLPRILTSVVLQLSLLITEVVRCVAYAVVMYVAVSAAFFEYTSTLRTSCY